MIVVEPEADAVPSVIEAEAQQSITLDEVQSSLLEDMPQSSSTSSSDKIAVEVTTPEPIKDLVTEATPESLEAGSTINSDKVQQSSQVITIDHPPTSNPARSSEGKRKTSNSGAKQSIEQPARETQTAKPKGDTNVIATAGLSPANAAFASFSTLPATDDYVRQLEDLVVELNCELARALEQDKTASSSATELMMRRMISLNLQNLELRAMLHQKTEKA